MKKMSDEVRKFIVSGMSDRDKYKAYQTIDANEENDVEKYAIMHANGWYIIDNGQIAASGTKGSEAEIEKYL